MAKTIAQSMTSLEASDSSLESSLKKCQESIKRKGVQTFPNTTFSELPALIDKIVVDDQYFFETHPGWWVKLEGMESGKVYKEQANVAGGVNFGSLPIETYKIYVCETDNESDYLYIDMTGSAYPIFTYRIIYVPDDSSAVRSVRLKRAAGNTKEFKKFNSFWYLATAVDLKNWYPEVTYTDGTTKSSAGYGWAPDYPFNGVLLLTDEVNRGAELFGLSALSREPGHVNYVVL